MLTSEAQLYVAAVLRRASSAAGRMGGMGSMAENLEAVRERIESACARAGRAPGSVRLLAVSKTHGPEAVREAAACGQMLFAENRVQEAAAKIPECPGWLQWHLIGHLQSNKAAQAARLFDWVHSVDSAKLLEALDRHAARGGPHAAGAGAGERVGRTVEVGPGSRGGAGGPRAWQYACGMCKCAA